jgi:DNA processing protein
LPIPADAPYWLALEAVPGLGAERARELLAAFGNARAVLTAPHAQLRSATGDRLADALLRAAATPPPEPALAWLDAPDAHFIPCTDACYPALLNDLAGAPAWLYVKGDPTVLSRPLIVVVGSRNATPQGLRDAAAFARAFAEAGLTVVSGLAEGIDSAAHEGGLAGNGSGVAVVGTGLDRVYQIGRAHV